MTEYWAKQYLTDEWRIRRLQILLRDDFKCVHCQSDDNLHVQHIQYGKSLMAQMITEHLNKKI